MKNRCECNHEMNKGSKKTLGIIIIIIGIIVLLHNISIFPDNVSNIIISWQSFLIVIGILFITRRQSLMMGAILITIGAFHLLPKIFNFDHFHSNLLWPIILIIIGTLIIWRSKWTKTEPQNIKKEEQEIINESEYINEVAIFGGSKHQINNQHFKGGRIVAIFGGSELDLRNCKLAKGKHELEINCLFGGTSLTVPTDWNISVNVLSILGGFADKRYMSTEINIDNESTLIIKGIAIFGGGEIKNH